MKAVRFTLRVTMLNSQFYKKILLENLFLKGFSWNWKLVVENVKFTLYQKVKREWIIYINVKFVSYLNVIKK